MMVCPNIFGKGAKTMFNFFLCIAWPLLIFGTLGAYKFGKKRWGDKGSWLTSVAFLIVLFSILILIFGKYWWQLFFLPYLAQ